MLYMLSYFMLHAEGRGVHFLWKELSFVYSVNVLFWFVCNGRKNTRDSGGKHTCPALFATQAAECSFYFVIDSNRNVLIVAGNLKYIQCVHLFRVSCNSIHYSLLYI